MVLLSLLFIFLCNSIQLGNINKHTILIASYLVTYLYRVSELCMVCLLYKPSKYF